MLTSTVCVALSAAGLAIALLAAYRRRYLAAIRTAAFALLPVGLYVTGLVTLGSKVGRAVGDWAADLVFKPSVWAGFAVLAVSVVLYVTARLVGRHRGGGRRERTAAEPGGADRAVAPGASGAPGLPAGRAAAPSKRSKDTAGTKQAAADAGLSDFGEIEEILKRRGI